MRNNLFEPSADEQPLDRDLCQRLHYEALVRAARGCRPQEVPSTVDLARLRELGQLLGSEVYLSHPEAVEKVFEGISIGVYRLIVELYCSRLERSIGMVWRIAEALARAAERADIAYEAVWALCLHLEERRRHETEITLERDAATWWLASLSYGGVDGCELDASGQCLIVCLLDVTRQIVLAFRVVCPQQLVDAYGLVLYDALVGRRRPGRDAAAGLSWLVPERLIIEQDVPQDYREGCARLGIAIETERESPAFFHALETGFRREISSRRLAADRWAEAYDSYLHKAYGYSPLRVREERDREFSNLVGYNRDPAWQCPALRSFLPLHNGSISQDGAIRYDDLHYADGLLRHWSGAAVTFRRSEQMEVLIWVYLEGELLCQALARELQRSDGSYRPRRPGR
jgi:hypothetical protein